MVYVAACSATCHYRECRGEFLELPQRRLLPGPTAAVQAGEHDVAYGAFEDSVGKGEGIVQTSAFVQLDFVQGLPAHERLGSLAASRAHGIDFIGDSSGAADRECCV